MGEPENPHFYDFGFFARVLGSQHQLFLSLVSPGHLKKVKKKTWGMKNVVWVNVNAEDPTNEEIWGGGMQARISKSKNHRQLILGNFWKKGVRDYFSPSSDVISFWIPFLSMNFNERQNFTPLDLNCPGSFRNRSYSAVYMLSLIHI